MTTKSRGVRGRLRKYRRYRSDNGGIVPPVADCCHESWWRRRRTSASNNYITLTPAGEGRRLEDALALEGAAAGAPQKAVLLARDGVRELRTAAAEPDA